VDPSHLVFLIWAATQHYADFAPQVRAVLGVKSLTQGFFQDVQTFLSNVVLRGVLPRAQDSGYPSGEVGKTSSGPKAAGRRPLKSNRRTAPRSSRKRT